MGKAIFFVKGSLLIKVLVKVLEAVEAGQKLPFFKYLSIIFFFVRTYFLKDSFNTTLYLLDFIVFGPIFGLFHYAKLTSYRRVR